MGARSKRGTLSGDLVAGHELLHVLAVGGMGEVYLARHGKLGMNRAVKVIHADLRNDATARERFNREAQVLARLQHNSIVQIVDYGSVPNGWPFLVMEYIEGPTLERVVEKAPLSLANTLVVLEQLANAVHYAHSAGVIHRDIKPSNILLRGGDVRQAKIIDFGLALIANSDQARLTDEKQMLGSVAYMAPEQVDRVRDVTGAVDIYALAGITYRLLSGSPPFSYASPLRLMTARVTEDPPPLSKRCPDIPAALDSLLLRCLARDPAKRPESGEVVAQIEQLARGTAVVSPAAATQGPSPPTDGGVHRIAGLLLDQPRPADPIELALATKIMAMVAQIVSALSISDPELTSLLRLEVRIAEQIEAIETELGMFGHELDTAQHEQRFELIRTLHAQQLPLQRRMVEVVERHRRHATGPVASLFEDIDHALFELESLRGMRRA
ncbi:MAG TPA: serine/threonine-protein kinase [Kofleriaceae bacterium]|nr:serine/threonine-protein kinase [Kofleriaceae bacterium]